MYSLSFDVYCVNIRCIGTEKTTMTQIAPYQLLSILKGVSNKRELKLTTLNHLEMDKIF